MCMHAGIAHCYCLSIDPCLPSPLAFWVSEALEGGVSNQLARNQMYYIMYMSSYPIEQQAIVLTVFG